MVEVIKKNWLLVVIAIVIVILIWITNGTEFVADDEEDGVTSLSTEANDDLEEDQLADPVIIVDVKGEVAHPGIYEVASDARVDDVIKLAGGFTKEANQSHVNLAQIVQDEMLVMVPGADDADAASVDSGITGENKVRINDATQAEIETLSGIGPSKAQTIIEHREEHGLFKNVEDLLEISGIGEKTLENIRDDIEVP